MYYLLLEYLNALFGGYHSFAQFLVMGGFGEYKNSLRKKPIIP